MRNFYEIKCEFVEQHSNAQHHNNSFCTEELSLLCCVRDLEHVLHLIRLPILTFQLIRMPEANICSHDDCQMLQRLERYFRDCKSEKKQKTSIRMGVTLSLHSQGA